MGFFFIAAVISILTGFASYFSWESNKLRALLCACISLGAACIAFVTGIFVAIGLVFKLFPLLLILGAAWLLYSSWKSRASS